MAERFYVETLGCPKNAVDSDKVVATLLADGLLPTDSPGDADLVVVNTCAFIDAARQESIDVALGLADGEATRTPGSWSPAAWPSGTATSSRRRCPRPTPWSGFADEGALVDVVLRGRKPSGVRDLLELPAPGAARAVGLREGRRGLRPRAAPSARSRRSAARSGRGRRSRSRRRCASLVQAGAAEIVLVAQDLAWYGRDVGEPGALAPLLRRLDPLARRGPPARAAAVPVPERGQGPARRDDARAADGRAVLRPVAPARGARAAAAHEALGERRPVPRRDRVDPRRRARRRVPLVVHRRVPGRDRGRPRRAARVPARRGARLGRLLPVLARGRHRGGRRSTAWSIPRSMAERLRECGDVQEPITQAARDALVGTTVEVLVDAVDRRRPRRPHPPRGARDRRRGAHRRRRGSAGRGRRRRGHRRDRSRPRRGAACSRRWRRRDVADGVDEEAVRHRRARDAGQLHHARPAAVRGPDAAAHRARRRHLAHLGAVVRAVHHRRHRRLARASRRRRPARARSWTRSPTRCSRSAASSCWCRAATSGGCRSRSWRHARCGSPRTASSPGARGSRCPRCGSASGRRSSRCSRSVRSCWPVTADIEWLCLTVLWIAVTLTIVSGIDIVRRGYRVAAL